MSPSQQSVNAGLFMTVGVLERRCVSVSESVHICVLLLPSDCTTAGSQRVLER